MFQISLDFCLRPGPQIFWLWYSVIYTYWGKVIKSECIIHFIHWCGKIPNKSTSGKQNLSSLQLEYSVILLGQHRGWNARQLVTSAHHQETEVTVSAQRLLSFSFSLGPCPTVVQPTGRYECSLFSSAFLETLSQTYLKVSLLWDGILRCVTSVDAVKYLL